MKTFIIHLILTIAAGLVVHETLSSMNGMEQTGIYASVFLLLWLSSFIYNRTYFRQFYLGVGLFLFFAKELLISNFKIIYYVITPRLQFRPAILKFKLKLKSKRGIVLLANLITLTPGTLTLDVSRDRKYLYYHTINVPGGDFEEARHRIRNGFEKRILKILK